jgi:hypothetical protein
VSHHRVARALIYTHRWLGIALSILFVVWFASGVVMMYARMPELDPAERLARLAPINFADVRIAPGDVAPEATRFTLTTFEGRPVYRVTAGRTQQTTFADTGEVLEPVGAERALQLARAFVGGDPAKVGYDARLEDADQWTFGVRGQMPMHRLAVDDVEGTRLYVAERSGEVVMKTTSRGRTWGYLGAVFHWLYFTSLRRDGALWNSVVVWTSVAGTVMALAGFAWGLWRFSPLQRYRLKRQPSRTPYAGLVKWHHYAGLIFGITTITWVFSGLLSMDPWDWHPSTAPTAAQRDAVSRGPLRPADISLAGLQRALAAFGFATPKEIDLIRFRGHNYLRASAGLVAIDAVAEGPDEMFHADAMMGAARDAMPGVPIEGVYWMTEYDPYYYSRSGELNLPVLRVRFDDAQKTWLYLDPKRGAIARKEERLTRLNRWLYHGLHSFDFPFFYYRRPLWDAVLIVLSLGGVALSVTTMWAAYRRVRRGIRTYGAGLRP